MTDVLLNALVPIFAVMGLGYFAGWIRDVDNHHVAELNALVMDFAVPAALFVATASASRHVLLTQWPLLLALGLLMLLTMTHDTARVALLLMALPSGFFGVLFGLRYGVESQEVGSTLIVSSLFSVITLTIALIFTATR
jgi:predicted permease